MHFLQFFIVKRLAPALMETMILHSANADTTTGPTAGRFFVDDVFTKAILKTTLMYFFRSLFFVIARRDFETRYTRYLFLTPPAFRHQVIYDRVLKRRIRFQVRNINDLTTASQVFRFSSYETRHLQRRNDILSFYQSSLDNKKTPLIVDCGGNIGLASLFFSLDYPAAKLVCIEPDRTNIGQARVNTVDLNVDLIEAAIGSESGTATIINPEAGNNGFQIEKRTDGGVAMITLPHLLSRYEMSRFQPFLLKIDIEGFEADLFSGKTDWIKAFPVIMIELHDWMLPRSANSRAFIRAIGSHNRDFVLAGESIFSIAND